MKVRSFTSQESKGWDEFVVACPFATFFHTLGWKRVVERTFSYHSEYFFAEHHGQVLGILPLFETKNIWGKKSLLSVPFGVYGGICSNNSEAEQALLSVVKKMACERGVYCVELRHQRPLRLEELPVKNLYYTFRRPLSQSMEENLESIPRKQRRMIRQGLKHGLVSKVGGVEMLDEFYGVYANSLKNLGTPVFPRTFFSHLLNEFGPDCRIVGVWKNNRMMAAVMTFFFKDQVLPYYGGALTEALKYAVYDFMYWELMCFAVERGCRVFDFGRSKKGTGAFDFKRHWGFEPELLPYQFYLPRGGTIPDMNPSNPKLKLPIEIWKRMPLGLTKCLGPFLVKYFP
jgi:FemAB-related protein (PEP-CTERM system-associated)